MRTILVAALLATVPAMASAEPLRFEDALDRAAIDGPSLEADRLEIEARRTAATTAGQWPDPKLGVSIENFPISGPPAFSLTGDDMTMARIGVSQEVPSSARRDRSRDRARLDADRRGGSRYRRSGGDPSSEPSRGADCGRRRMG